jgi:electron transfer flavoprotein alpha subunit
MALFDKVFVLAEQRHGAATSHALELCAAARSIAGDITAFTWSSGLGGDGAGGDGAGGDGAGGDGLGGDGRGGGGPGGLPAQLAGHGVTKVWDLGSLGDSLAGARVAAVVAEAAAKEEPGAVLGPATYDGRDIAGRLSARLDRPVVANVMGLELSGEGALVSSHMLFGGAMVARARYTGAPPGIFLVTAKSFKAGEPVPGATPEVVRVTPPELGHADAVRVIARHAGERQGPSLEDAKVVVSGGRGLGSPEQYELIEELARLLGGAPGATRAIVDAGWAPYAYQVGQTGRTVNPEVYLAFGISGATQHLVGMKGAGCIIAVNSDPEAPMMKAADLGIVADVRDVLPKLIEAVKGAGA